MGAGEGAPLADGAGPRLLGALGHLGTLAGLHHERLDGSGYRGVSASFLPVAAQILAAADAITRRPSHGHIAPP